MVNEIAFLEKITTNRALWLLFIATLTITAGFPAVSNIWGVMFIDGISSPDEVRIVISQMSAEQKIVHAWVTATLDVAYPLSYGLFFAGTALRFFSKYGLYLATLPLIAIPVDLIEGVVQVLALTDTADFIGAKAILTPAKSVLFVAGFCISVAAWVKWIYAKVKP
ncbi:MAG: hypothetical protein ACJAVI_005853 [Candidatus Azotimanducaceae bacterium]|jgi:hypothetical protein